MDYKPLYAGWGSLLKEFVRIFSVRGIIIELTG
jgi:hypothetical protein